MRRRNRRTPPSALTRRHRLLLPPLQGNISKWRKREGDKVAAGDVLAEIETVRQPRRRLFLREHAARFFRGFAALTRAHNAAVQDKATMEMEAMEDGFAAKILKPDGAQNVLVGEARTHARTAVARSRAVLWPCACSLRSARRGRADALALRLAATACDDHG
jgi:multidrug efflux pump subunit AcrA (membrane-fusion protein)